jgi:tetratricopeptide (TPR) repeat protein
MKMLPKLIAIAIATTAVALGAQGFDFERVRGDMFAALMGDVAATQRALTVTEQILAGDPQNAPALSAHGLSTVAGASQAFNAGDAARGAAMLQRGMAEMNQAATIAPNDAFVRVVRGLFMQSASRQAPAGQARPMLETAQVDFQFLYDSQVQILDKLGEHRLGELLQALGDIHARLGRVEDAKRFYRMIQQRLPNSEYARRAGEWLQTRTPLPPAKTSCVGCHIARG